MQDEPRVVKAMADVMIKLLVLLRSDFGAGAGPERRSGIDRLVFAVGFEHDRQSDMVRIGMDDPAEPRRVEILVLPLAQMHDDLGAARGLGRLLDRELALAVRHPPPAFA